jgi:hypothetical protein
MAATAEPTTTIMAKIFFMRRSGLVWGYFSPVPVVPTTPPPLSWSIIRAKSAW